MATPRKGKKRPRATPDWLIRAHELAELLGVGPRTLTRMIQERKIGPRRIIPHRRSIGWDRGEIEIWLRHRGPDGQWYDEDTWARLRDTILGQHRAPQASAPHIEREPLLSPARSLSSEDTTPGDHGRSRKRG